MTYQPVKTNGGLRGLLMGIIIFGFVLWGINFALGGDDDNTLKIMLLVPAYIFLLAYVYLLLGAFSLSYKIDKDALEIKWGMHTKRILWNEFMEIIEVKGKVNLIPFLGVAWQGYTFGLFSVRGIGSIRMYGTDYAPGFLYLKTKQGFYGITPGDAVFLSEILNKTGKELQVINADKMTPEEKGESFVEDPSFSLYYKMNVFLLLIFSAYLAVFFPGSDARRFIVLFLVLALALFFFNVSNAKRLYRFSSLGAYATLLMGVVVTGIFLILSVAEVSL